MKRKWFAIIGLALALILAVPVMTGCGAPAAAQTPGQSIPANINISQQQQGIWVSGTGELSVTPDIATLNLGVNSTDTSVAKAQAAASEAMAKIMQALADNGIASKDIQTGYLSIYQRTRWDNEKNDEEVTGYQVNNMVTVKIRAGEGITLEKKSGAVIDAVIAAGGDLIRINGINFTVEDPSKYYTEVRQKAMDTAKAKAEELAKLAGVTLGKATYIVENAQYTQDYNRYANFAVAAPAPAATYAQSISPGQTSITLSVQVAYEVVK